MFEDLALKQLGKQHFSDLFGDDKSTNIADQLKVISLFPHMTTEEHINRFLKPISVDPADYSSVKIQYGTWFRNGG